MPDIQSKLCPHCAELELRITALETKINKLQGGENERTKREETLSASRYRIFLQVYLVLWIFILGGLPRQIILQQPVIFFLFPLVFIAGFIIWSTAVSSKDRLNAKRIGKLLLLLILSWCWSYLWFAFAAASI